MDVDQSPGKVAHKALGQDAHETGQHHHVGRKTIDHPGQLGIKGFAAVKLLVVQHGGGNAPLGRKASPPAVALLLITAAMRAGQPSWAHALTMASMLEPRPEIRRTMFFMRARVYPA